jgi:hypothetical protein
MAKLTKVTLPTASMMARSGLFVGPHSRCTSGIAGVPLTSSQTVGSLRSQIPVPGWHLKNRSSRACPSGVNEAIVPDFDHATVLPDS